MATSKEMTAGPALPLIFNFTLPLLFGNLLQKPRIRKTTDVLAPTEANALIPKNFPTIAANF